MKSFALSLLLLGGLSAAHAQDHGTQIPAPIERRFPEQPPALYGVWPMNLPPKSRVLVTERAASSPPFVCKIVAVGPDELVCAARHGETATFARAEIEAINHVPRQRIGGVLVKTGLIVAGLGIFCGVDGGPVCVTPAAAGLGIAAAGVVLWLVEGSRDAHGHNTLIYLAPPADPQDAPAVLDAP